MKKKMLYMSHVDWNWIKQRPQFVAEGLAENYQMAILYLYDVYDRSVLQDRDTTGWDITPIYPWKRTRGLKPMLAFAKWFARIQFLRQYRRVKPDYVYLTYPPQVEYLPDKLTGKLLYDCMDDHLAMAPETKCEELRRQEQQMLDRADVVLVSSQNLKRVLIERYGDHYGKKIHLVRNGYSGGILPLDTAEPPKTEKFTISYIGTIGKWFNFDYILRSLKDIPGIQYRIIGPSDQHLPQTDGIIYTGTVEHDKLFDLIRNDQCLMMPFVVNDVVASVDPVKLYEYINYNKNILCVHYPEIDRFAPFVHFYEDYESFLAQIKTLMEMDQVKYSQEERLHFLQENNWESRVQSISDILEQL